MIEHAKQQALPDGVKDRIEFAAHDFLTPQSLEEKPDEFLLRPVLHNWPQKYAIKILKNLIPALRPGAKVLIYEIVPADSPIKDISKRGPL